MVAAETFDTLNIHSIVVDQRGAKLTPCTVNGSDHYPGLAEQWESASGTEGDVDVFAQGDGNYAGVLVPDGNHDLDTVLTDDDDAACAGNGMYVWVKFVASCGALIRDALLSCSATAGYFTANSGVLKVLGRYLLDSDQKKYHADVAAVTIGMIEVISGGITAVA